MRSFGQEGTSAGQALPLFESLQWGGGVIVFGRCLFVRHRHQCVEADVRNDVVAVEFEKFFENGVRASVEFAGEQVDVDGGARAVAVDARQGVVVAFDQEGEFGCHPVGAVAILIGGFAVSRGEAEFGRLDGDRHGRALQHPGDQSGRDSGRPEGDEPMFFAVCPWSRFGGIGGWWWYGRRERGAAFLGVGHGAFE